MIKINTIDDIKKATDSELYEYFTINFIKDTAQKIGYQYTRLYYYLERKRKLNFNNIKKKQKTLCIKNFTKADWLKMLETQNWQDIAISYNLSKTTIYKKLRQYNIKLKQLNIKYNNKCNNKIYLYLDRKEFIRNYCLKCHLWTDRKNISYWKPDDCFKYGCMKFDKNNFLELKYNQDNDTVFYFGSVKNIKFFRRDLWQKKTPEKSSAYF